MRRLLIKELRSAWWIIGLAYAMVFAVVLMGDPLGFRGDEMGDLFGWLIIPFLVLGLRAYSGELGAGTVEFLYSRPIKWWQVFLAKLMTGVLAVVSTVLLGLLAYVLTAPHYYLPFLHEQLLKGLGEMMLILGVCFVIGFGASVLMPGIALSFASLVGIAVAMGTIGMCVERLGKAVHMTWLARSTYNIPICAAFAVIAVIPITRSLPKLGARQRWRIAGSFLAASVVVSIVLGAFGIPGQETSEAEAIRLSPNGQWALYGKDLWEANPRYGLVDTRTGKLRLVIPVRGRTLKWSPDSSMAALASGKGLVIVRTGPKPDYWKPGSLSGAGFNWMTWSPDSRFLLLARTKGYFMLDVDRRTIRTIHPREFQRYEDVIRQPGDAPVLVKEHGLFWPPHGLVIRKAAPGRGL